MISNIDLFNEMQTLSKNTLLLSDQQQMRFKNKINFDKEYKLSFTKSSIRKKSEIYLNLLEKSEKNYKNETEKLNNFSKTIYQKDQKESNNTTKHKMSMSQNNFKRYLSKNVNSTDKKDRKIIFSRYSLGNKEENELNNDTRNDNIKLKIEKLSNTNFLKLNRKTNIEFEDNFNFNNEIKNDKNPSGKIKLNTQNYFYNHNNNNVFKRKINNYSKLNKLFQKDEFFKITPCIKLNRNDISQGSELIRNKLLDNLIKNKTFSNKKQRFSIEDNFENLNLNLHKNNPENPMKKINFNINYLDIAKENKTNHKTIFINKPNSENIFSKLSPTDNDSDSEKFFDFSDALKSPKENKFNTKNLNANSKTKKEKNSVISFVNRGTSYESNEVNFNNFNNFI